MVSKTELTQRSENPHDSIISKINTVVKGKTKPSNNVDSVLVTLIDHSIGYKKKSDIFD